MFLMIAFFLFVKPAYASAATDDLGDTEVQYEFATFGEGYTAASEFGGITAWPRAFSAPDMPTICGRSARPAKLLEDTVVLHVYESFPFDRLRVLAVDASGNLLPPVPISLTTDDTCCLIRTNALLGTAVNWVVPVRPGRFRFRFGTMCNTPQVSVEIQAEVRESREDPYLGPIAQGYTSASQLRTGFGGLPGTVYCGINAAFGMFSSSSLPEICEKSARPAKLVALEDTEILYIGLPFFLTNLRVLAVDTSGRPLPPVPIMVEADDNVLPHHDP